MITKNTKKKNQYNYKPQKQRQYHKEQVLNLVSFTITLAKIIF